MKSVLIIDGSALGASLLADFFKQRGWFIAVCSDHDSAKARLASSDPYDVVLFGFQVSGEDGVKLISFIRALERCGTTAIVVLTGSTEMTRQVRAAGGDAAFVSPASADELISAVEEQVH